MFYLFKTETVILNIISTYSDPEEFISMERATQFAPKSNTVDSENIHCYLLFNVQPTHHISNIRLTSEASKIEVFTGDDAEYLTVQFGQLLDQVDDMGVYLFDFQIPNGVEKVSLKVNNLKHYNVFICITNVYSLPLLVLSQETSFLDNWPSTPVEAPHPQKHYETHN